MVVGGGGSKNPVGMARLQALLSQQCGFTVPVVAHEAIGLDSGAKECLAFALLGFLTLQGAVGNVPSCTGAAHGAVLGKVCYGTGRPQESEGNDSKASTPSS